MESITKPPNSNSSVIALDLIRGLAALLVLLGHVRTASFVEFGGLSPFQRTAPVIALYALTRFGNEAVLAFFVLSGFLVGGQLISRVQKGRFDIRRYAIDRCTRIFIPLVPACLFTAAVSFWLFDKPVGPGVLLANMIGLNGISAPSLDMDGPLWTLSYEIWFYVVAGAVGFLTLKRGYALPIAVLSCSAVIFSMLGAQFLLYWALGAIMVLLLKNKYRLTIFVGGFGLTAVGVLLFEFHFSNTKYVNYEPLPTSVLPAFICIGIAGMLPFLCSERANRALSALRVPAAWLGSISYSLYLFHFPVNAMLDKVFPKAHEIDSHSLDRFAARLVICLAASVAFYFCFERNTVRVRRWLTRVTEPSEAPGWRVP